MNYLKKVALKNPEHEICLFEASSLFSKRFAKPKNDFFQVFSQKLIYSDFIFCEIFALFHKF